MSNPLPIDLNYLLSDSTFRRWVYAGGVSDEGFDWAEWIKQNPDKTELVKQATAILKATHLDESVNDKELDEIVTGSWDRIAGRESKHARRLNSFWWSAAAAAVILMVISYAWKNKLSVFETSQVTAYRDVPDSWIKNKNTGTNAKLIILSDSSSVMLFPGSTLSYPKSFEQDTREVSLRGAAFFEIAKQKQHPFLVQANGLMTRVTGTSFSVRAFNQEPNVQVIVKTGHVTVYADRETYKEPGKDAVTLRAEQQAVFSKQQSTITQGVALASASIFITQHTSFNFTDIPVAALLDSIAHTYGLNISYDAKKLKKCVLTTALNDLPLQGKLKIICKALGDQVQYQLTDKQILITGLPGCN
ncbi:FecR family protein [Dyadobacter sp. LHD-138]|uniref:FecR family protein n=1 Tax=Dyadobacter sp. LHD-138 TaxID=3071413 RepID=UPI0027DFA04D|nr:FecR family protein [Dyadobacter sp. LHD-138]MDQ6477078.1 FecR family protein [Dyadobacter sp. LHD-138]